MEKKPNILVRFWKLLGPGLITDASDDDPSGIATYSQAGASLGLSTLWTCTYYISTNGFHSGNVCENWHGYLSWFSRNY
jgi:hypothetical protein